MKKIVMGLSVTGGLLASSSLFAHVGEHGGDGWLSGVLHLLTDHGYLLLAVVLGGLVFNQVFRARG